MPVTQEIRLGQYLDVVADSLAWYCRWRENENIAKFGNYIGPADHEENELTLQEVFDAYTRLPENHPLRRKYDSDKVIDAFSLIRMERQENRKYQSLARFRTFVEENLKEEPAVFPSQSSWDDVDWSRNWRFGSDYGKKK